MTHAITILVGTMAGTAELVAQEVQDAGFAPRILSMEGIVGVHRRGFLVVSSTYGNGEVPDNTQAFFVDLEAARPDLSRVILGVTALGDITDKATFCNGGLQFDRLLRALGTRRLGEPLTHNPSSAELAEHVGAAWAAAWAEEHFAPALAA